MKISHKLILSFLLVASLASVTTVFTRTWIVTALTFVLAIFSGLYISFLISHRIGKLKEAIRKVGSGQLDTQIEIDSDDELGDLSRSFNGMIDDLKQSSSSLAAAKLFTDKVLESMIDFVVVTDMDLNITQVNKAALGINGYDEQELIGKSVNMLMADRPFNQKGVEVLRKNGFVTNLEKLNLNKDGSVTPISMSLSVFKDERGNDLGIVCVGKDVSDRKRREMEQQAITEIVQGAITTSSLDELFEIAYLAINRCISAENCYIALHDATTGIIRYEFWKDKTRTVPDPHPIQNNFGSYILATNQPVLLTEKFKQDVYDSGAVDSSRPYSPSWMGVPLQIRGNAIGILVAQDYEIDDLYSERDLEMLEAIGNQLALAIERKLAEETLRAREQHFRSLIENSSDAIALFATDGAILYASPSTPQVLGYTAAEMRSFNALDLIHPDDKSLIAEQLALVARQPRVGTDILGRVRHKDGSYRWVEGTFTNLLDDPNVNAIVNNYRDVTDRKRADAETEVISKIIQGVTSTANLDELLELIHQSIGKVLDAENCFVALYDPTTEMLDMQFWADKYDPAPPPFKMGKGFTAYVCRTERAMLMTRKTIKQLLNQGEIELQGTAPATWLGVPLRTSAGMIGVLALQHYEDEDAYCIRDLELLVSVGSQIALAIERKRIAEAVRISEQQHRLLFETNPQPAYVYDLETLAFLAVNEAALRHYGYSREEFRSSITLKDLHPAKDIPQFLERVSKVVPNSDTILAPSTHQKKNGTVIDVEITSHALNFADRPAEIVLVSDITERKTAEEKTARLHAEIEHQRERLNDIIAHVQGVVWETKKATNNTDPGLDFVSDYAETMLGYPVDEWLVKPGFWLEIVHPDDRERAKEEACAIYTSRRSGTLEYRWIAKDGREVWVESRNLVICDEDGEPIGVRGVTVDITERKQAQKQIIENEEKFRDLFDNAPIAYHELDVNGLYTRVNRTEELLLGYTNDELRGRHPSEFIVEKVSREATKAKLAGKMPLEPVERTFIRKDGTLLSVLNQDRLILDANGETIGIRSTLQDITARKHAEEQLNIFNEKLQQSNRELQDFAYVASHDLQEPLRKVQAFSDRLKTKYGDKLEGDGLDYLERMRSAASRMQLLIQDLLTFSRVSTKAQPFIPVNLETITREVLSDLEVKIEETGATIQFTNLPIIDADPLQMRQLMQNLIGNALKFQQKGTAPHIMVSAVESNGSGTFANYQISVKDNGIGFDEKYADKIFAVFQRLHGRTEYEGSGVGLSICRKIAERHNGSITAQSSPGDGSTFTVTLPLTQSKVENI
jgi:PAS domain S-box-containing protein